MKCTELGKHVNVLSVETGHDYPAAGQAVMTFECDWRRLWGRKDLCQLIKIP
jgi:hypothetical protein